MQKPIKMVAVFTTVVFICSMSWAAELKLAYVDTERVLAENELAQKAVSELRKLRDLKDSELRNIETEVDNLAQQLEKQRAVLSESKIREREQEIQQRIIEGKRVAEDARSEMRNLEDRKMGSIASKLNLVLEKIGKDNGYTMIVRSELLLYASPTIDITDQVIEAFNKQVSLAQ